ncbi:MAG: metallophosphoesterase [Phycisphaerae bacterium]|nr:metallophosphoesterase [Phycisphaerae bacterium]
MSDIKTPKILLSRRRFLRNLTLSSSAGCAAAFAYAWRIEPTWVETVHVPMSLASLGSAFQGYRLVQVSDLHAGPWVPQDYLECCIDHVSALQPDLVVVTGDLVSGIPEKQAHAATALLARIQASDGVLVVLGNHDYACCMRGHFSEPAADRVARTLSAPAQVRVLRNERHTINRGDSTLRVVGIDEYWTNRYDPDAAFRSVPAGEPCIALVHNPDTFLELLDRPAQWFLAGHTHGGQVTIPGLGPPRLPVRHREFASGHHVHGDRNLYVNRGLGWVKRIRFGARPEITVFTLQTA